MDYQELIEKAIRGRSVNAMAKVWGLNQPTLRRYVNGERLPDFDTALKIAREAGVEPGEAFEVLAAEERNHKSKNFRLQMGFATPGALAAIAMAALLTNGICTNANAHPIAKENACDSVYIMSNRRRMLATHERLIQRAPAKLSVLFILRPNCATLRLPEGITCSNVKNTKNRCPPPCGLPVRTPSNPIQGCHED